ncbi:MAG TPA: RIO1 family regulatory kinase/ATPase [Chloroflexia bacterium]|nr:RIO1 family regulatory kinase/ATPase [Chloroflexia bacterium]
MSLKYFADYLQEWEKDPDSRPRSRRAASIKRRHRQAEMRETLVESGDNAGGGFNPSFSSSRHEREWILTYLGPFYDDQLIADVLRQVKGGKEANVYCCQAHAATGLALIAAKVYRPQMFRNLRNDARYRQGRAVRDEEGKAVWGRREQVALTKKTRYGQDLRHTAWLLNEFETLRRLHAAGLDVPQPLAYNDNAILMEYRGAALQPAPLLSEVSLAPDEARPLFDRLIWNVEQMLACDRVHGDLSAHNILYWDGTATIIDFPQAVDPAINPDAFELLARDVVRLCQYFARWGVVADAAALAADLWQRMIPAERDARLAGEVPI